MYIYNNMINPPQYCRTQVQMPTPQRNYCIFDRNKVDFFVKRKEIALPYLSGILARSMMSNRLRKLFILLTE